MNWVKEDETNRVQHLPELLLKVRMHFFTPQYLSDRVAREKHIKSSFGCENLIEDVKEFYIRPEMGLLQEDLCTRLHYRHNMGLIYVCGIKRNSSEIGGEYFYPVSNKWHLTNNISTSRTNIAIAVLDRKLYTIGGYKGCFDVVDSVEEFNLETQTCRRVAPMKCKRSLFGACSLNNKLYVCGGYDGFSFMNCVERYNPVVNEWSIITPMIKHRRAHGIVVFKNQIFAIGGQCGKAIFNSVSL